MELVGLARRSSAPAPRGARRRSRPSACRSRARSGSTPTSRGSRPITCSCAAGARSRTSRARRPPCPPRRLLAQRHQLDHRGLGARRGLDTLTAAHDLDREQLLALLARAPRGRVAVTVHHHIPTFHTEHCVYAHLLSNGRDFRTCGRPCEQHASRAARSRRARAPGRRRRRLPQHRVQRAGAERREPGARPARARRAPVPRRARARDRRGDARVLYGRTRSSSPARWRPPRSSAAPPSTSSSASRAARCARSPCCGSAQLAGRQVAYGCATRFAL